MSNNTIKLCKDCEYFHIKWQPKHYEGMFTDAGMAVCTKHDLVTEFITNKKFLTLYCIESEEQTNE